MQLQVIIVAPHLVAPHLMAPHLVAPHLVVPHNILMCTWPPRSLQSLSLDLLNKMATSLAQNKTMAKLTLTSYVGSITLVQDAKLFICHLLVGLIGNKNLTDLTLRLPANCWDWPQGEFNYLHTV